MNTTSPQEREQLHLQTAYHEILAEISWVLGKVKQEEVEAFLREIDHAHTIVACGAGRVGMAVRGFAMRLGHLGKHVHMLGDATVPALGKGDLLIVASGSGETQTVYDIVEIAHKNGARIALVTGNSNSRMGKLAHTVIRLSAPSKTKQVEGFTSSQPMTTLNEQCLGILFDSMVLMLMSEMGETHDSMWARHSNLE